ncbi:MAG: hypothetical protein IPK83_16555 [Planctomycetes bacterium]|nr:hypothetical protein [Planctomycetota bacterium]
MDRIAREGTLAHIDGIPEDVKQVFVCAHDIRPEWHVQMQAAFQRHCDSSISKTINFAHDANPADVEQIYKAAYELRCKGVTVYRDGCRSSQPMALADSEKKHKSASTGNPSAERECCTIKIAAPAAPVNGESLTVAAPRDARDDRPRIKTETNLFGERIITVQKPPTLEPKELPPITSGIRVRQQTPFGNMHIQITVDPRTQRELEVFAQLGKGGDIANSDLEAICRMISLWLRAGGSLIHVTKQLTGIGSHLQIPTRDGKIMSLGDGLAQALKRYTRAKERHGLRALLLGEIDPADIEKTPEEIARKASGNGNGKGNGNGHSTHDDEAITDVTLDVGGRLLEQSVGMTARSAYRLKCPECSGDLDMGEGCTKCHACGYAQC